MRDRKGEPTGIKDYRGVLLHEGDVIKHPEEDVCGTVFWDGDHPHGDHWRVMYDDGSPSGTLVLQVGDRGMAVKVGSIY